MEQIYEVEEVRTESVIASEIRTIVTQTQKTMLDAAIEIGRRLVEAKELVAHGEWGPWLKEKVEFSQSAANRFMRLFDEYGAKQGTLFGAVLDSPTLANMSYTKALALLALPEEDREEFAEKHDAANLSVRELEKRIEEYQNEKEKKDELLNVLEETIRTLEDEKQMAIEREEDLSKAIENLKKNSGQEDIEKVKKEMAADIVKMTEAKLASDDKIKKLESRLEQLRADHQSILVNEISKAKEEAVKEAKSETDEEMRKLMLTTDEAIRKKEEAEKKLALTSDTDLIEFRFFVSELQKDYQAAKGLLEVVKSNDPAQGEKLEAGLRQILLQLADGVI